MLMFYDNIHDIHIYAILNNYYYLVDACSLKRSAKWMMFESYSAFCRAGDNDELSDFHTYHMYSLYVKDVEFRIFGVEYDFILACIKGWCIKKN